MPASAARRSAKPDLSSPLKEEAARAQINIAEAALDGARSPARALQARLEQDLQAGPQGQAQVARWPLYAALTFWGGVSTLMWAAIIACVWMLIRHI
jgi:hypothetical protein